METQNVSAQLYNKQLPSDPNAGSYNCQPAYPYLSTCVNNTTTDAQIENAFQDQLNLSEYYKSPNVFNTIKRDFMDQTMEYENTPVANSKPQPEPTSQPVKIPVGPTDFLNRFIKESFGSTSTPIIIVVVIIVLLAVLFLSTGDFFFFTHLFQ